MADLTDAELPGYCEIHCRTDVALFHSNHINRLLALAGNPPEYVASVPDGWRSYGPAVIDPLVKLAQERKSARAHEGSTMTNGTTASQPKSIGDDAQDDSAFLKHWDSTTHEYGADVFGVAYKAARAAWFAAPAAQASATIQAAPDKCHWCPECGSEKSTPTGYDNGNYCSDCGQEWFPDIDYTDAIRQNLAVFKQRPLAATIQEPVMVAEPVAYADPKAFQNFVAGTATNEWMWAKPDVGLVPIFLAAPMVADPAGVAAQNLELVIARLEQIAGNFTDDYRNAAEEALVCARSLAATVKAVPNEAMDEPAERESLIACLEDDANPDDEMAQTMKGAAEMLRADGGINELVESLRREKFAAPLADNTGGGE